VTWLRDHPLHAALAVGVAVTLCAMAMPWMLDDWLQIMAAEAWLGSDLPRAAWAERWVDPLGLPNGFYMMPAAEVTQSLADGVFPWWTDPELQITFWRPLSSLLQVADSALFGRSAVMAHAHSGLWYLALIGAVVTLLKRLLPDPWVVLVAALLFAVDEAHWMPLGWLANRNALVAGAFGLWGVVAHLRWREGWRWGLPLSLLGLGISLLAGEAGVGCFGILAGVHVVHDRAPWGKRLAALLPAVAVGCVWALAYRGLGFGSHNSGMYLDPGAEPLAFLAVAPRRLLMLTASALGGVPADLGLAGPQLQWTQAAIGLVLLIAAGAVVRAQGPEMRRGLAALCAGAGLAAVPILATFPLDRLTLLPGIAGHAVVAVALVGGLGLVRSGRSVGWLAAPLLLPHAVVPCLAWPVLPAVLRSMDAEAARVTADLHFGDDEHGLVLDSSDPMLAVYAGYYLSATSEHAPASWGCASLAYADHTVTRTAADTLVLRREPGTFGPALSPFWSLFRHRDRALQPGDQVDLAHHSVRVLEVDDGGPNVLELVFDHPVGDGPVHVYTWDGDNLVPLPELAVGETLDLPHHGGVTGL
jgi:hypothetical protein